VQRWLVYAGGTLIIRPSCRNACTQADGAFHTSPDPVANSLNLILPGHCARLAERICCRLGHVADLQILNDHHCVIIADCRCAFVKAAPTDHRILTHISYIYFKQNSQIHGGKSAGEYPSLIY
jgi:hypothetical protein